MWRLLKWLFRAALVIAVLGAAGWFLAPPEPARMSFEADGEAIADDPAGYLAEQEAAVPGIVEGAEKRILWSGDAGGETDLAVLYVHGFSATSEELRPVPDRVAAALGANLVFTRLTGHGRDGTAMAEARVADWTDDMAEALAVARTVGRRVLVIGTSTGGTLAAVTAAEPGQARAVAGMVFVSPNFGLSSPLGRLLEWPAARLWLPRIAGRSRGFAPVNEEHARWWTESYPTVAVLPMAALVRNARGRDWGGVELPALFLFAEADRVVSAGRTRAVAEAWGGSVTLDSRRPGPGDDPSAHVLAGDILSPGATDDVVATIVNWAQEAIPEAGASR